MKCVLLAPISGRLSNVSNACVIYVSTLIYKTQLLLQVLLLTVRGDLLERIKVALNSKDLTGLFKNKITGNGVYTLALATQKKNYLFLVCIFFLAPTKSLMHTDKHEASVVYYTSIALGCAAIA